MRAMTPRDLDWIEQAPVKVTSTRRIEAPIDRVWEALADHEGWADWFGAITRIERIGSGEGVGSGRRVFLKGGLRAEEEFLAWEPEERFAFTLTGSTMPGIRSMVEDIRLQGDRDAAVIAYTQALEPAGARLLAPVLRRTLPRSLDAGLAGLAKHVVG